MAKIETLVKDIEEVLTHPHIVSKIALERFGGDVGLVVGRQLLKEERSHLSMSMLGTRCDRQLQYKVSDLHRIKGEELTPSTRLKFMYGDLIEALILLLAREAGHLVQGEQDELSIGDVNPVFGHRDAIIDGVLVDIKSASTFSFAKFKKGLSKEDDSFGYLTQLSAYLSASQPDPLVVDKSGAAFVVIDKQFGHITVDYHKLSTGWVGALVDQKKHLLASRHLAPRSFEDEPDGKSGNRKLGTNCSYCAFKRTCWTNLQVYNYSNGPRFLTKVIREPDVSKGN